MFDFVRFPNVRSDDPGLLEIEPHMENFRVFLWVTTDARGALLIRLSGRFLKLKRSSKLSKLFFICHAFDFPPGTPSVNFTPPAFLLST